MGGDNSPGTTVLTSVGISAVAGTLFGSVQAAWMDRPMVQDKVIPSLKYSARRIVGTSVFFAVAGGVFSAATIAAENMRHKKDAWNTAWGGAATGALVGARAGSISRGLLAAGVFALVCGVADWRSATFDPYENRAANLLKTWQAEGSK